MEVAISMSKVRLSNFTITDNRIMDDERLGVHELLVYHVLCRHANADRSKPVFPSQETIAEKARCSTRTVIRALKKLEEFGYIRTDRVGKRASNRYFMLDLRDGDVTVSHFTEGGDVTVSHFMSDGDVTVSHSNNSNNQNINKTKEINNKRVTAKNADTRSTKTLFTLPQKTEAVSISPLDKARQSGKWDSVTDTEFLKYFIARQNERFPTQIQYVRGKNTNYIVSLFRSNFLNRHQISQDQVCGTIDKIIDAYAETETDARYSQCFSLDTFKLEWKIDKLVQSIGRVEKYGSSSRKMRDYENIPEVF
jgi:hypothetical protein